MKLTKWGWFGVALMTAVVLKFIITRLFGFTYDPTLVVIHVMAYVVGLGLFAFGDAKP